MDNEKLYETKVQGRMARLFLGFSLPLFLEVLVVTLLFLSGLHIMAIVLSPILGGEELVSIIMAVFTFASLGPPLILFSIVMEFFIVTKMKTLFVILTGALLGGLSNIPFLFLGLEFFILGAIIGGFVAFILKHHYERKKNLIGNRAISE